MTTCTCNHQTPCELHDAGLYVLHLVKGLWLLFWLALGAWMAFGMAVGLVVWLVNLV